MNEEHLQRIDRETLARAIQHMDRDELRLLNRLVVDRLKLLDQAHSTAGLAQFSVGDRINFADSTGQSKSGTIIRLNKKTASILTDDQQQWNVSPHLLGRIKPAERTDDAT